MTTYALELRRRTAEIESLKQQLAESQEREVKLRDALNLLRDNYFITLAHEEICASALALPSDTTALNELIIKAGEVMRRKALREIWYDTTAVEIENMIRALPGVTLEDLK